MMNNSQFSEEQFKEICDRISNSSYQGCGQSDILFTQRFSGGIQSHLNQLPQEHMEQALEIARSHGYMTEEEFAKEQDDASCAHGLDPYCCPCGCGDLEY